jgi:hypothetical protein
MDSAHSSKKRRQLTVASLMRMSITPALRMLGGRSEAAGDRDVISGECSVCFASSEGSDSRGVRGASAPLLATFELGDDELAPPLARRGEP